MDHTIRDWQHTICQDGIVNTHIGNILHAMHDTCDIELDQLREARLELRRRCQAQRGEHCERLTGDDSRRAASDGR